MSRDEATTIFTNELKFFNSGDELSLVVTNNVVESLGASFLEITNALENLYSEILLNSEFSRYGGSWEAFSDTDVSRIRQFGCYIIPQ
jgi:hypothetical protein